MNKKEICEKWIEWNCIKSFCNRNNWLQGEKSLRDDYPKNYNYGLYQTYKNQIQLFLTQADVYSHCLSLIREEDREETLEKMKKKAKKEINKDVLTINWTLDQLGEDMSSGEYLIGEPFFEMLEYLRENYAKEIISEEYKICKIGIAKEYKVAHIFENVGDGVALYRVE